MKIEAGKYYKTRDGSKVRILCTDAPNGDRPCIGYKMDGDHVEDTYCWAPDGSYYSGGDPISLDLVEPWTEKRKL